MSDETKALATSETRQLATIEVPPMVILQQMVSSGADAASIATISALCERWEDRQSEKKYAEAMNACQKEMPVVLNDAENKQTNSRYTKLDTLLKPARAVWLKHGFSVEAGEVDSGKPGWIRIRCLVRHIGGHSEEHFSECPMDNRGPQGSPVKTEAHGWGSAATYAYKRLVARIFSVVMSNEDDDDGNGGVATLTMDQCITLEDLIQRMGEDEWPLFFKFSSRLHKREIKTLAEISVEHFDVLVAKMKERVAARDAK